MLKSSGLGQPRKGFGGGPGEDQFATFLVRAQAEEMAKTGGFGLAESIFQSLMARQK
ncbi:rod-binding protein [Primorskyibacter sp. S87]|uniref:rod-binding protein n=1 Tax=Primorskyibacter sp. S87 TaxID=3415126 RepID=UPI003C7D0525